MLVQYLEDRNGQALLDIIEVDVGGWSRPYDRAVDAQVVAEDLRVGTVIDLPTEHGDKPIRLISVQPRMHRVKIEGLDKHGAKYSSSFAYGQMVTLADPTGLGPSPERPA